VAAQASHNPFGKDGSGDSRFAAGGAVVSSFGGVLGSDYNHRDYAVLAGSGAWCFLGTIHRNADWGSLWRDCGDLFWPSALVFGVCVFALGLICAAVRVNRSAYRFGGVTLGIMLLIPRTDPAWQVAFHRFAEVSIGIVTALIFATVWPEMDEAQRIGKLNSTEPKSGSDQIRAGS
jgi:Fusaric acid resistance protein-like